MRCILLTLTIFIQLKSDLSINITLPLGLCKQEFIGDGKCDDKCNNEENGYDKGENEIGDCCLSDASAFQDCFQCLCLENCEFTAMLFLWNIL